MKKGIWKTRKLLGFIMSLIMIFSLMPGSLSYAEGEKTILTDIEELKELKVQSIEQGTLPDELELPTELKASGYLESGSAEETAEMTVKVKKWQVRLKESVDKEEEGEWKDYKETTEPGVYYFRPVLDETYQLAEGVELPMYALEVSAAEAQTEVVTEAQTEAQTEVVTEAQTEAQTEVVTEAQTEAQTEVVTEAQTEAQTEVITEAQTEAQTEVVTEAQTEAQTEVITEAQTEAQTEVVTEAQTETDEFLIVDESSQTFMNMGSSDALTPINDGTETETETSALPPANNGLLGTDPLTSGQEPTSESETQQSETGTTDGTAAQSETGSTDTAQTTPAETEPQTTETNPTEAVSTELTVPLAQSYQVGQSYQLSYSLPEGASVPEGTTATYTVLSGGDCVTVDANGLMTVLKEGAFTIQVSLLNGQYIGSASSTAVCTHVWTEATCTAPQTCSICGATQGEALGHDWADATCTEPQTCTRCGATQGEALGHDWADATCTEPQTCTRCGATQGEALGHDWTDATCTEPQTCARCGATQGKALGHDWMEATCTDPETCSRCGETRGEALGHNWTDATCTDPETCARCGETRGEALGHDWTEATCTDPETCSRCGETRGEALGHDWTEATCTDPETCSRCKETRGEALGHSFGDWVVTTEPTTSSTGERTRTCTRCGAQEKETVQRLNIVGNASDNTITGISSELVYGIRRNITFEANGAGMSNTSPINGDVRYVPTTWVIGKTENSFGSAPYSVTFQMANAGTFTLRVNFQKQTYNNGWQSSGEYDVKEVTFQVSENGTAGSATTTGSVQTGDNTQIILFVVLLIVAAVVIGVVIVAGRKKKR